MSYVILYKLDSMAHSLWVDIGRLYGLIMRLSWLVDVEYSAV